LRAEKAVIKDPGGAKSTLALGTRDFTLPSARTGVYTVSYLDEDGKGLGTVSVPVSLLSDSESNIAPAATLRVRGAEEALAGASSDKVQEIAGRREVRANRELYTWLILVVLLLISVEWFMYHQRGL
jgi:hypothetical protein